MEVHNRAIETVYKGYRFRSRLEARWACFYDALGVKWEYEKEGYILGDGTKYLPDFYLPDYGWIEIKGNDPTEEEQRKAQFLGEITHKSVYIFFGEIPEPIDPEITCRIWGDSLSAYRVSPYWDNLYEWCRCPTCGKIGIQFEGRGARICQHGNDDHGQIWGDPVINNAYHKARSTRFEFGESGL